MIIKLLLVNLSLAATAPYKTAFEGKINNENGWKLNGDYTVYPSSDKDHKLQISLVLDVPEALKD